MGRAKSSAGKSAGERNSDAQSSEAELRHEIVHQKNKIQYGEEIQAGYQARDQPPMVRRKNAGGRESEAPAADVPNSATIEPPPAEVAEPDETMSAEEIERARKRYLLKRFWISARGFWGESGEKIAWIGSVGLLLLIVLFVAVQYGINVWNRKIFDAIEKRDSAAVLWLSAVFFPLAFASVALGVTQVYARMGIQRRWRAWLTNKVVSRWLNHGRYYQLNLVAEITTTRRPALPKTCGSPPMRPSILLPASLRRSCPPPRLSLCFGPSAAR